MKVNDKDGYLASMKADKYKEAIFKFCQMLEDNYGATVEMSYVADTCHRAVRIDLVWPDGRHLNDNIAYAEISSFIMQRRNDGRAPWTKEKPATYHRLFNSMFRPWHEPKIIRFFRQIGCQTYSTPEYTSFSEFKVALDMRDINLHIVPLR